jgi:hypothetical protein
MVNTDELKLTGSKKRLILIYAIRVSYNKSVNDYLLISYLN